MDNRYKVLLVDDEPHDRKWLTEAFSESCDFTLAQDTDQLFFYLNSANRFDLMLLDLELVKDSNDKIGLRLIPEILKIRAALPIVVVTKDKSADTSKAAMDAGALDFLIKTRFDEQIWLLAFEKAIKNGLRSRIQDKMQRMAEIGKAKHFIGESPVVLDIKRTLEAVGKSPNTPLLILGETGTGKEVAAKYLHAQSQRKNAPFVAVNLSAIQETLLESTLFGSVKGGFTDARDVEGYFRQANGGMLLLDEIGDISQDVQIKLLRFLEDRIIRPVGSDRDIQLDIQIIAATHQNLEDRVEKGTFRSDLYQRLKVVTVKLPPLRSRPTDIELLFQHYFGDSFNVKENFTSGAWEKFMTYHWPGNIRELRNVVDYLLVRQLILEKHLIDTACLPPELLQPKDFRGSEISNAEFGAPVTSAFLPFKQENRSRLEAISLLNLQYIEDALIIKNKVKQDAADMLHYKSADSLLYDIKTSFRDFPHLFSDDAFPTIRAAYPQIFK